MTPTNTLTIYNYNNVLLSSSNFYIEDVFHNLSCSLIFIERVLFISPHDMLPSFTCVIFYVSTFTLLSIVALKVSFNKNAKDIKSIVYYSILLFCRWYSISTLGTE